jgi:hypothetical protein
VHDGMRHRERDRRVHGRLLMGDRVGT